MCRVAPDVESFCYRHVHSVGRYDGDAPGGIVFQSVERTLQAAVEHFALAQHDAAVDAFIVEAAHFAAGIAPEHQVLAHADDTDRFVFNLDGLHDGVLLVADHNDLPLNDRCISYYD